MAEYRRLHRALAALAATLGVLALAAGDPAPRARGSTADRELSYVTAVEVARWIRATNAGVGLIDIRTDSAFDAYHVPGAEHVPAGELAGREWARHSVVVLYAEDDERAAWAARLLRARGMDTVHVLRHGLAGWVEAIVQPRLAPLPPTATPADEAARREHLELSRYFGGTPFVSPSAVPTPARVAPSEAAAVARVMRRGC